MDEEVASRKTQSTVLLSSELLFNLRVYQPFVWEWNNFFTRQVCLSPSGKTVTDWNSEAASLYSLFFFFGKEAQTHGCVQKNSHSFFFISTCCSRWDFSNPLVSQIYPVNESKSSRMGRAELKKMIYIILLPGFSIQTSVVNLQVAAFKCWWRRSL